MSEKSAWPLIGHELAKSVMNWIFPIKKHIIPILMSGLAVEVLDPLLVSLLSTGEHNEADVDRLRQHLQISVSPPMHITRSFEDIAQQLACDRYTVRPILDGSEVQMPVDANADNDILWPSILIGSDTFNRVCINPIG